MRRSLQPRRPCSTPARPEVLMIDGASAPHANVPPMSIPPPDTRRQRALAPQFPGLQTLLRKEVIQPHLPVRLPCYDFTPVTEPTVVGCLLAVGAPPSGRSNSHGVTGGVYKARERIHRVMLLRDY